MCKTFKAKKELCVVFCARYTVYKCEFLFDGSFADVALLSPSLGIHVFGATSVQGANLRRRGRRRIV